MKNKYLAGVMILITVCLFHLGSGWAEGEASSEVNLKKACIKAAIRGIKLEIAQCQKWIDLREQKKVDDTDSLPGLKADLLLLQADLQKYQAMKLEDYKLPEKVKSNAWVEGNPVENSILYVDGMSRSGPWFHLTGITGDDYGILKPETKYQAPFYKVYPRNYFQLASCYVYVSSLGNEEISKEYPLTFETYRVNRKNPISLTQVSDRKIQLVADIIDGGGITKETVTVKKVETAPDQVTVIHLLYMIDGQSNKAFFTREMKAVIRVPAPGKYRVKLWTNELFHQTGEVFAGEKEIEVKT